MRPLVPQSKTKGAPFLYQYRLGVRLDPGAAAEVLEPSLTLPVILFRGNGRVAGSLAVTQPPQVFFNGQIGLQGLGGVAAGQMFSQALIDPSQLEDD